MNFDTLTQVCLISFSDYVSIQFLLIIHSLVKTHKCYQMVLQLTKNSQQKSENLQHFCFNSQPVSSIINGFSNCAIAISVHFVWFPLACCCSLLLIAPTWPIIDSLWARCLSACVSLRVHIYSDAFSFSFSFSSLWMVSAIYYYSPHDDDEFYHRIYLCMALSLALFSRKDWRKSARKFLSSNSADAGLSLSASSLPSSRLVLLLLLMLCPSFSRINSALVFSVSLSISNHYKCTL